MSEQRQIEDLLAKQACTELVYTIARGIDRLDADLVRSAFHPDGVLDFGYFSGRIDEFLPWVMGLLPTMKRTQHVIGNVLIRISGDTAAGESYVTAYHDMAKNGQEITMIAGGRYLDQFERRAGAWKLTRRTFISDWNAEQPLTDAWDRSPGAKRHFGRRGSEDPSCRHFAGI
jgi:hypothetical protein